MCLLPHEMFNPVDAFVVNGEGGGGKRGAAMLASRASVREEATSRARYLLYSSR